MSSNEFLDYEEWEPLTRLGRMVKEGQITSIDEIFAQNLKIQEAEIVDILLPDLEDEVIDIKLVQRQSDAGRKRRFRATVVVGNKNGYVGVGEAKLKEIGPAIKKAITNAKLNVRPVRRACGSWECSCGGNHTVPYKVEGKCGSTKVVLIPAPRGLGLVVGDVAKTVLRLAGIDDVWSKTFGETRTTNNFAKATFEALKNTYSVVAPFDWTKQ
ncbi:MAG: 30S ribosomal protein S5 [Candidatus Heimdallarchaeum endolithica]|uniref:Small ribosomal subunit protein uS5 n=1 Tax=Candidatus Heimdallarchaeum endolithica TaxID=2876572 RepID=A0A9Y1BP94_9ARCH|nr:MAG: 30S ribosomal protein S5 [Candidatus Heimdallarchaeum endolithica]